MKITLDQHRKIGAVAIELRELLMQANLLNIGKASSIERRSVHNALKYIDRMRCELDSVVCREFHDCNDVTRIYY